MTTNKNGMTYIHLDGDGIGDRLELFFLDNDIEAASRFSQCVSEAVAEVKRSIESISGSKVLLAGGDDVVAMLPTDSCDTETIADIADRFRRKTGCTISGGMGDSAVAALENLRRAKLSGKGKIISSR